MKSKENIFETIIEKYRYWIGGILILAIIGGSAVLIWRENYSKPKLEDRIGNLESRIDEIVKNNQETRDNNQLNSNIQSPNIQMEPEQGTVAGASSQNSSNTVPHLTSPSKGEEFSGKINVNTATEEQLISLPEIGPATAKKIMDYRAQKGPFKTIDELDNVSGIGKKTIDKFREFVTVN